MDIKHAWEIFLNFLKSICDNWFVIVFFLGITVLLAGHLLPNFSFKAESLLLGNVIVFSSVFASFTRWISVRGIVKKTLSEILSSKEFLSKDKNFDSVWNNLVEVSIEKHNPSLKGILENSSVRKYIPQEGELFYSAYSQHMDASWADEDKRLVKIIETTKITVTTKDRSLNRMPYVFNAGMPIGAGWKYQINSLKVGTTCCMDKITGADIETDELAKEDKLNIKYKLDLEGNTQYQIHRVMLREICLDYEPYIILVSGKHTLKPEISFSSNGTGIKAAFNSTGTLEEFDTIDGRNNSSEFTERHPGLMLKGQGFIICLSK
ncbi:hypothetical protein [Pseudoalteromonas sp. BSi20495]|uniref:hypothetical protein n=1 Tax=Pseudoalteromonas sp. BSi20495 TaxID=386429 RepID=UPI0002316114|nr:hypothetical protein [Pseudoalteromonas sp. BSi20495]GAA78994.1 hypothetical protein P20495_1489 [Pseudoalteromonas sp. BSi20495]